MINYIIILGAYLFLMLTSGRIIRIVLRSVAHQTLEKAAETDIKEDENEEAESKRRISIGSIIGKCENLIVLTFILLQAYTALALVFTAKTIVRKEEIEKNSIFFLAGTMINVTYSIITGFVLKIILVERNFDILDALK